MLIRLLMLAFTLFISGCSNNMWRPQNLSQKEEARVTTIAAPHNIAIMLPLKGKGDLAFTSQAIHNGLLAAYYASPNKSNIKIQIVDTSVGNINDLYRQAVANGADIIVGPLTKPEVESIASIGPSLPVPTIALNTIDNYQYNTINNLYQFGLLPQDEAIQVAAKMTQEQLNDVAIIIPDSLWGERVAAAFEHKYISSGGRVAAILKYKIGKNLADQICNFLANDAILQCTPGQHKNKKNKDPNEIMRRQDINAIFLVATTPAQARQIVPLLKFYYASDLPIYSISTIYSGTAKPDLDQDINGVYFCDTPWVIQTPDLFSANLQAIHKQITGINLWANTSANYSKFYALGIDAYTLAVELNTLLHSPQSGIKGASGTLYLDNFNHIYRELQWTQIKNGVIR